MSAPSPTIEGFRAAFRRPSLTFAEIAWRWTLGATAVALFLFCFIEYLDTLPVTTADSALLSTRQPAFVVRALTHILRGSLNRAVLAALLVTLSLSVLWIIAASIGRLATVRALLHYFRERGCKRFLIGNVRPDKGAANPRPDRSQFPPCCCSAGYDSGLRRRGEFFPVSFRSNTHPRPGLAFTLFIPLAGVICIAGWGLNWWLSLAGIFAVRNGEDALAALSAAVSFFRERTGSVVAVSTWTGLAHLIAFSIATTVVSLPLAFIPIAPLRLVIAGVILVTLAYFAVVDWLYIARLAGYVCIAEMPDALLATSPLAPTSPSRNAVALEDTIDRDEPILSDVPNLAVET